MSGIFGFFDPDNHLTSDAARRMADALAIAPGCRVAMHRVGPGCIGVVDKGIFAGAAGILSDPASPRHAVLQGEILACRGTEDELAPADRARRILCRPLDDEVLASAVGPFSAAILDENTGTIELTGDRYGWYLTYYAQIGRTVLFAGQVKAILATGVVPAEVDDDALAMMLTIGEVVNDLTMIRGVRALPAAAIARIDENGLSIRRYWHYRFKAEPGMDFEQAAERAGELLRAGVARMCRPERTVGVPLSGGLDSRVVLAAAPDPSHVESYTWGLAGCRDLRYAGRAAAIIGSPHHSYVYDPTYIERMGERGVWLTEGLSDAADMHVLPYVETVRAQSEVVLDGMAGDAILGGNFIKSDWQQADSPQQAVDALWRWRFGMLGEVIGEALLGRERYRYVLERARSLFRDEYLRHHADTEMDRTMAFLLDNRVRRCSVSGTHLFRWRLEVHYPFYDSAFFDHLARLPHAWRHRHRLYVEMIRRCFPKISQVPWQRTGLPAKAGWPARFCSAVVHRINENVSRRVPSLDLFPGRHVARFDEWFRGPLHDFVHRTLCDGRLEARGLVRPEGLQMILDRHQSGSDLRKIIGVLIALELFHRLFIDDFTATVGRFGAGLGSTDNAPAVTGTGRRPS